MDIETRKQKEAEYHDKVRDEGLEEDKCQFEEYTSNRKFYSIARKSEGYKTEFFKECAGKKMLDFCCGDGAVTILLAEMGIIAYGFDISPVSIEIAKKKAMKKGVSQNCHFFVMDAENLEFEDSFFDFITVNGVLHHLDIDKAYREMQRVLKSGGKAICGEPLIYNPVFHLYRKLTPKLRTEWEVKHILSAKEVNLSLKYFEKIDKRFFHLFTLLAVPLRNTKIFKPVLSICEAIDYFALSLPGIKWLAWQIIFVLSNPIKVNEAPEDRKAKEIEYYDREAEESLGETKESGSRGGVNPKQLASYSFLYELVKENCANKMVLDYGCGAGIHLENIARISGSAIGVDLSKKSINAASERIKKAGLENKAKAIIMDCEKLGFKDNSFDVVFDGGTFSSLDLDIALKEIYRVLKPSGIVIGIETFGHNPITNFKRSINRRTGKRTSWAADHILKINDFEKIKKYFNKVEVSYYGVVSWAAYPFANLFFGPTFIKFLEFFDKILLAVFPFLKKYSFKVVFKFSEKLN